MEQWGGGQPDTFAVWIVFSAAFLLVLLVFITLLVRAIFKRIVQERLKESKAKMIHQQKLLDTTIQTQEVERKRIAEDLHDELIGKLMVIKLRHEAECNQQSELISLVNESIETARRISHDLSPPLLEFTSLADLLFEMIDNWKVRFEITTNFDVRKNDLVSDDFKIQFLRITQETITNIDKHAKASKIDFHFRQSRSSVALKIVDNGVGFDKNAIKMGLGLKSIETRVQFLKGSYHLDSKKDIGTSVLYFFNKF